MDRPQLVVFIILVVSFLFGIANGVLSAYHSRRDRERCINNITIIVLLFGLYGLAFWLMFRSPA